jgi:4'-phosphopantetheinyl transferase
MDKNAFFMESIADIDALPGLGEETIHIWGVHMPDMLDRMEGLYEVLHMDEREKAKRFFREADQQSSIAARGALRILLAGYMERVPAEVGLHYSDNGKPYVSGSDVAFNLSHSGDWVVLAFGRNRRIGVDVEKIRRDLDIGSIAARCFNPEETALLDSVADKYTLFFQLWARKEAYVKACGSTLFREMNNNTVPLIEGGLPEAGERGGWFFRQLEAGSQYAAALVTDKPLTMLTCCDFGGLSWES